MNPYFVSLTFNIKGLGEHQYYSVMDGLADAIALEENAEPPNAIAQKSLHLCYYASGQEP